MAIRLCHQRRRHMTYHMNDLILIDVGGSGESQVKNNKLSVKLNCAFAHHRQLSV